MTQRNWRLAAIAATSAGALALAGCAGSGTPTYDEPVDLTMTVWTGDETILATFQALADEFREENPELGELTIETIPFAEYNSQLAIRLSGGDAPDLGWIVESATPAWVDSGALHDVSVLKDDADWDFDDIIPNLYAELEGDNGEIYGYPFAGTTHPVMYNVDVFEEAGVTTPAELLERGEWTWESLRQISKEMVDSGVVTYGFDIPQWNFTSYALFTPFLKGFGGVAYPGGDTCGFTDPATVEAFEFVHDMIFEDGSYPTPGNTSSFPTGDTAMFLGAPSALAQLADSTFAFDMVPQPEGDVPFSPFIGQASMVVWEAGETTELATRLFAHFTSKHGSEELPYVAPRFSLATPEFIPARYAEEYPGLSEASAQRSLIDTLSVAQQIPYPVEFPQLETATKPALDGVCVADADIAAQLAAVCEVADPILAG